MSSFKVSSLKKLNILFYLAQIFSNFFKYSSSNFLSFYSNKIFTVYFSSNSLHLNSFIFWFNFTFHIFSISSCYLTFAFILPINLFTNFVFSKSFSFSYTSFSTINLFYLTKYFIIPLTFHLFKIFFTSHSSILSTSTGFGFSTLCFYLYSYFPI